MTGRGYRDDMNMCEVVSSRIALFFFLLIGRVFSRGGLHEVSNDDPKHPSRMQTVPTDRRQQKRGFWPRHANLERALSGDVSPSKHL